jgi:uncharacterized protein YdhG (YjbR/CyaY superfamily)
MKKTNAFTVNEYIAGFPPAVRGKLEEIRSVIRKAAPDATEIISYGMAAYKLGGILVYFAAHKDHVGFYPLPSAIERFKKELSAYKHSKGAIQFPYVKELPVRLIERITSFRVMENEVKSKQGKN